MNPIMKNMQESLNQCCVIIT